MLTPRFGALTLAICLLCILGLTYQNHRLGSVIEMQHKAMGFQELYIQDLEAMLGQCTTGEGNMPAMPSSRQLLKAYKEYNHKYWGNRLPAVKLKWDPTLWSSREVYGEWDETTETIAIAKEHFPLTKVWKMTLLHEMAHVATEGEVAEHGPLWHKEIRRLFRLGAFDDLI